MNGARHQQTPLVAVYVHKQECNVEGVMMMISMLQ